MPNNNKQLTFKTGVKDGIPIGLGYFSVSFAFGVSASLPVIVAIIMSMTNLTSAGQKTGAEIIAMGGTFLEIILTQIIINARYFLMSTNLSQKLEDNFTLPQRLLCSAFITDEIFAISSVKGKPLNKNYILGLALIPYLGWALGTTLGAIAGDVLPLYVTSAFGIALYAMFIAIIIPPIQKDLGVLFAVIISVALSCALYYLPYINRLSYGFKIIISAIVSAVILSLVKPVKETDYDNA